MRRIFVVFLIVVFSIPVLANPFSDVTRDHWAYKAVKKLADRGIITGYSNNLFKGNKTLTRYELAMIIARFHANSNSKLNNSDNGIIEKLTVEFADELALLGVKVTALEDEFSVIKNDISTLKQFSKKEYVNNGKIFFSGEVEMRAESNTYKKSSNSGIYSPTQMKAAGIATTDADNFNGIIGNRTSANQTNENALNFRTKVKLFMDARIDENVSMHVELRNRLANSNYNVWRTAQHSADDEWATDVYEAYVLIQNFYGVDCIQIGRAYTGLKDSIAIRVSDEGEGDYGGDGIKILKKLSDVTTMKLFGSKIVSDEDLGLNFLATEFDFDLKCGTKIIAAYALRYDSLIFDPTNGFHYGDVGGVGANLIASYTGNANYAANHENPTKVQYYGVAVSGNIVDDLKYYGRIVVMDHIDTVLDPEDPNWINTIDKQKAYLLGLKWKADKKINMKFEYRWFDEYYRPIVSSPRLYGAIWGYDYDGMGDYEFDNLGYTSDFNDIFIQADYQLTEKTNIIGTYEKIDDTRSLAGQNRRDDDMDIWTLGFGYKYRPNMYMALYYKHFDLDDISNGATGSSLPNYFVDNNANGSYDMGIDYLNLHDSAQEDHEQLRCELKVKF